MTQPLVSVTIITYKQEEYIVQCIESVLAQKVNFPYEIIIGDDMSPDKTRAICQLYADKYDFIHLCPRTKNLGVAGNWADCMRQTKGKYIMMLDGDDYWQNPNKMQTQVDFMEARPECVLCHTDYDKLRMKTSRLMKNVNKHHKVYPPEGRIQNEVLSGKECMTSSTICMRGNVAREHIPLQMFLTEDFPCEDWPAILIMSAYGEVRYIPISTTTYRVGIHSVTNKTNYEDIRTYNRRSKHMTECLYQLFPKELGEFKDGWWFDASVYNVLLNAAYENNDFEAGKTFAAQCYKRNRACKMTKNKFTFELYRLFRILKKQ